METISDWFSGRYSSIKHGRSPLSTVRVGAASPPDCSSLTAARAAVLTDGRGHETSSAYSHELSDTSQRPRTATEGGQSSTIIQRQPRPHHSSQMTLYPSENEQLDSRLAGRHTPLAGIHEGRRADKELVQSTMDKYAEKSREVDSLVFISSELRRELEMFRQNWRNADENYRKLESQHRQLLSEKSELEVALRRKGDKKKQIIQNERTRLQKQDEGLKRKLLNAEQKVIDHTADIRSLKTEIELKDHRTQSLQDEIGRLRRNAEEQQGTIERTRAELRQLDQELEQSRLQNTKLTNRVKALTDTTDSQAECIQDLEHELGEVKHLRENQAQDIRKLQEKAFQPREEAQWFPDTNADVNDQLNNIGKQIQKWCRIHSSKTALHFETLPPDDQAHIEVLLSLVANRSEGGLRFRFDDPDAGIRIPELLLASSLSHALYDRIFSNPFFFEEEDSGTSEASDSGSLIKVWSYIRKNNRKAGNRWAAQTLRLLDPYSTTFQTIRSQSNYISKLRRAAAERFSLQFVTDCPKMLLDAHSRKAPEDRNTQLIEIALKTAEISYRLWTQRRELSFLAFTNLEAESSLQFNSQSSLLEHHPLHNVQLSQDETALDGRTIKLVTHPAAVAYGDSDGEDYSECTILKKAVVWMG